jgi:hypothetical protein
MDASAKGQTSKSLRWAPDKDGKQFWLNATQTSGGNKSMVAVSITKAEYWVLESVRVAASKPFGFGAVAGQGNTALLLLCTQLYSYTASSCQQLPPPLHHRLIRPIRAAPSSNPPQLGRYAVPYLLGMDMVFA